MLNQAAASLWLYSDHSEGSSECSICMNLPRRHVAMMALEGLPSRRKAKPHTITQHWCFSLLLLWRTSHESNIAIEKLLLTSNNVMTPTSPCHELGTWQPSERLVLHQDIHECICPSLPIESLLNMPSKSEQWILFHPLIKPIETEREITSIVSSNTRQTDFPKYAFES